MVCDICKSDFEVQEHFKFQKNPKSVSLYGELLDLDTNKQRLCSDCSLSNPFIRWTEIQFSDALGIEPASIEGRIIFKQLEQKGCCG